MAEERAQILKGQSLRDRRVPLREYAGDRQPQDGSSSDPAFRIGGSTSPGPAPAWPTPALVASGGDDTAQTSATGGNAAQTSSSDVNIGLGRKDARDRPAIWSASGREETLVGRISRYWPMSVNVMDMGARVRVEEEARKMGLKVGAVANRNHLRSEGEKCVQAGARHRQDIVKDIASSNLALVAMKSLARSHASGAHAPQWRGHGRRDQDWPLFRWTIGAGSSWRSSPRL